MPSQGINTRGTARVPITVHVDLFSREYRIRIQIQINFVEFQAHSFGCDWRHQVSISTHPPYLFTRSNIYISVFIVRPPTVSWGHVIVEALGLHLVTHSTINSTPLDEWSACRRCLHLTTRNTYKRKTRIYKAGFEPVFPTSERPQTHDLDPHHHWDRPVGSLSYTIYALRRNNQ
jgi:hypothetical protein